MDEYGRDRWFVTDSAGDWTGGPFESRDAALIAANAELRAQVMGDNELFPAAHREALERIERLLKQAANYAEAYGGPVVDGTQYSPSDRAISEVEDIYQSATPAQLEHFAWALDDLYGALGLTWEAGILWRDEDLPYDD